jgi:3'-phosphoadenosine 5'-phosphosulfate sulfotransferase (PAPS reductase)/FAD synthetase
MEDWIKGIDNYTVLQSVLKAKAIIGQHSRIYASISGGADSDIVLDMCEKVRGNKHIDYVWFNTGLEFQATKDHLDYLEQRYGIEIIRLRAEKPVPYCVHEYGVPFKSKYVSDNIGRLQKVGFQWEDEPIEVLIDRYPEAVGALNWWCNTRQPSEGFEKTMFNINSIPFLKEFLVENPPPFKVSNKCCTNSKKEVAHKFKEENACDLEIVGVRKAEGGIRSSVIKTCFSQRNDCDVFRPIYWLTNEDKQYYEKHFGIVHSDCYTKYGMKRTGCVGCPYALDLNDNLDAIKEYEPRLYKACWNVFGKAYEYTRQFKSFRKEMNDKKKNPAQITMYELGFGQEEDDDDLL